MKKSKIFIGILILLAAGAMLFYNVWNDRTLLAEIHKNVKQTGMIASSSGFTLSEEDEVEISVKSTVYDGNALITLQNENHEILYTFDANSSQKEILSLDAGTYNIRIDSEKFKGNFDIVVRTIN